MNIYVAKSAGFCGGVAGAVNKALELAEKHSKVYTLGELVHNELVTEYLRERGVEALPESQWRNLKAGDVALIRAHGIPLELEEELREKGVVLHDATCKVVKKIHHIVDERHEAGDFVYVVGDKNHDEVVGTFSHTRGDGAIISEEDEVKVLSKPCSIVFQTTILADKYQKFCDFVVNLQKNTDKSFGIFDTICYTTKARQDETRALAQEYDAVLVLGSHTSANTRRLYEVAKEVNDNVFFVENPSQLNQLRNKQFYSISIVAGASTPPWLIQEVTKLMSETLNNTVEVKEEATLQAQANAADVAEKELTMEDIVKSDRAMGYANYKKGKKYDGIVLNADENGIYVGMQIGKKDGFIDKADAEVDGTYDPANYKKGDSISGIYTGESNKDYILLSKKEVDLKVLEDAEAEKALAGGEFDLTITEVVKGGLRGRLGSYTVFVPASHVKMGYVKNLEDYKGKTLHVVQLNEEAAEGEDDKAGKKSRFIVASAKKYLEREKQAKEDEFWNSIHVHDIVNGKVKRFTAFGAFVSVKGFDCLAHISELSWNKITDPSTVLTIGESYDFVVLKMDRATGKISLGYKQLQKKPYEAAAERFPVGTVIKGKVERIFSYGAFISICEGVDGLVHVSQISHNWIKDANEVLKAGEEVEAKIIGFEENRITLSIKELLPAPEVAPEVPAEEGEAPAEKPKKNARIKKFEEKVAEGEEKRERRPRKAAAETTAEPKEFIAGSSSASLGDLFKGLKLDLEAEEATEEEAPKKKTTRKKKTEDAE